MRKFKRLTVSLDMKTINLGKLIAERLGLSFSALVRVLINQQGESLRIVTSMKDEEQSKSA